MPAMAKTARAHSGADLRRASDLPTGAPSMPRSSDESSDAAQSIGSIGSRRGVSSLSSLPSDQKECRGGEKETLLLLSKSLVVLSWNSSASVSAREMRLFCSFLVAP